MKSVLGKFSLLLTTVTDKTHFPNLCACLKKTKEYLTASQTVELPNLPLRNITASETINVFVSSVKKILVLGVKLLSRITSIFAVQPESIHLLKTDGWCSYCATVRTMTEKRPCDSGRQTKESETFSKITNLRTKISESGKFVLRLF